MAKVVPFRRFSEAEHETWRMIFEGQEQSRNFMVHPIFARGVKQLGIHGDRVPELDEVNEKLTRLTGFRGVAVEGLEDDASFYPMLAAREFPIGNFIRDRGDISYTPAPDVIHDLYGHLPFLADRDYADFCADMGARAARYAKRPDVLKQFARLFWFTIEFGLIGTPEGRRIFGAGIASSMGECRFALSDEPEVVSFDIDRVRKQDFKIDEFQKKLFLISDLAALYSCLPEFERRASSGH